MISPPLKKGFLPSSTPIRSLSDSGYFGSGKSSCRKAAHALSPIKESLPFKKRFPELTKSEVLDSIRRTKCSPNLSSKEFLFCSDRLVKILDFNDSSDFSESLYNSSTEGDDCDKTSSSLFPTFQVYDLSDETVSFKEKCRPYVLVHDDLESHLNNTNYLHENNQSHYNCFLDDESSDKCLETLFQKSTYKIDFFEELNKKNCILITERILSLLSSDDLCKLCCVNKRWREMVETNKRANSRRKDFLKDMREIKENKLKENYLPEVIESGKVNCRVGVNRAFLSGITNTHLQFEQPLVNQSLTKFDSFIKEGKYLTNGVLKKCPRCFYAAKSPNGVVYSCTQCKYSFCQTCSNPICYTQSHKCTKPQMPTIIGTKRSKRNLKRL